MLKFENQIKQLFYLCYYKNLNHKIFASIHLFFSSISRIYIYVLG